MMMVVMGVGAVGFWHVLVVVCMYSVQSVVDSNLNNLKYIHRFTGLHHSHARLLAPKPNRTTHI